MKITRIIFGCNMNSNYIQFWNLAKYLWKKTLGPAVIPTLIFIAPPDTPIDNIPGSDQVIYFPISNHHHLPSCFIAQCIRLLAPCYFPQDICIIVDIDLFVIHPTFIQSFIENITQPNMLVMLNRYPKNIRHHSLCYHIASGETFQRIMKYTPESKTMDLDRNMIYNILHSWYTLYHNGSWNTDELVLHTHVSKYPKHLIIQHNIPQLWGGDKLTISHYGTFQLDKNNLKQYIEFEPPYPLLNNISDIQKILSELQLLQLDSLPNWTNMKQTGYIEKNRHPLKKMNGIQKHIKIIESFVIIEYSGVCGGLGDRIVGFVTACNLSQVLNKTLLIKWDSPVQDVFDFGEYDYYKYIRNNNNKNIPNLQTFQFIDKRVPNLVQYIKTNKHFTPCNILIRCNQYITCDAKQDTNTSVSIYKQLFTKYWKLVQPIPKQVYIKNYYMAIQLRTGDSQINGTHVFQNKPQQMADAIIHYIQTHYSFIYQFYVTSDNLRLVEYMRTKLPQVQSIPSSCMHFEKSKTASYQPLIDDLYHLIHADVLFISKYSNFGRIAAIISDTCSNILTIDENFTIQPMIRHALLSKHD